MTLRSLSIRRLEINGRPHSVAVYSVNRVQLLSLPAWMNPTVPTVAEVAAMISGRPLRLDATEQRHADTLTRRLTCFDSLADMLDASGHYRPSLECRQRATFDPDRRGRITLANYYDRAQAARGDTRRAFRY